ncbi:MAG: thiamine phosphate synthase [Candidatus Binatia bacterium]
MGNLLSGLSQTPVFPSGLYAIFDPTRSRGRPLNSMLRDLLRGGARLIQLRAKTLPSNDFFQQAIEVRRLTRQAGAVFIVNDRVDIALASQADGVHLGQEDIPLAVARRLMGEKRIIGISTHDLEQAREAEQGGADYIGFGPIFATATKDTGYAPKGLGTLEEICRAVKIPIVAIGGITENDAAQVWMAGANAVAIISDLMGADDVAEKARKLLAIYQPSSRSS